MEFVDKSGLVSGLIKISNALIENDGVVNNRVLKILGASGGVPIDAAIFMAVDGYGDARISGTEKDGTEVDVKTSDYQASFRHDKDPAPHDLYERARYIVEQINEDRHLEH